jgi:hypothetical protein
MPQIWTSPGLRGSLLVPCFFPSPPPSSAAANESEKEDASPPSLISGPSLSVHVGRWNMAQHTAVVCYSVVVGEVPSWSLLRRGLAAYILRRLVDSWVIVGAFLCLGEKNSGR